MPVTKLKELIDLARSRSKKRIVVAYGQDVNTLLAVKEAYDLNFAEITLVGDKETIEKVSQENNIDSSCFTIVHEPDEKKSGQKAVQLINEGKGDVLMKGLISTDKYLKCILDKVDGLMIPKVTLTHISITELPSYHKLIVFADAAFIPAPDIQQKIALTNYVIDTARKIGVEKPKVALISFTEKSNPKIQSCVDAAIISKMGERGQIKHACIDGPLALDVAVDPQSVKIKGLKSCVEGDADCLVFPNLESANTFFKTITKLANGEIATYIVGTRVPAILPSRGDSEKSKLYSIAFACLMAE